MEHFVLTDKGKNEIQPGDQAIYLLASLEQLHHEFFPEAAPEDFFQRFVCPFYLRDEIDTSQYWQAAREARELTHTTGGEKLSQLNSEVANRIALFFAACAHCVKALRTDKRYPNTAWSYLADARYLTGLLCGRMSVESALSQSMRGTDERHRTNRVHKKAVFAWCDDNMYRFSSMDDAALDIAESFVPQKFRAVRKWMTEWKKLRSTGT